MEQLSLEKFLIDGKEMPTIPLIQRLQDLREDQIKPRLSFKRKRMETLSPIQPTEPIFQENHISLTLTTPQLLLDNLPTDGKVTLNTPPIPRLLALKEVQTKQRLSFKNKSTQMLQPVLSHKKLTNNTMEFNNSRSHSTLQIKKSLMITRTCTILTRNQIQVLMLRLNLIPKLNRMETLSLMMPTMPTFQESHILSTLTTPLQL